MSKLEELAERVERLLLRLDEVKRTTVLLEQQLAAVTQERDSLRSRLNAARGRIDALLERLPADTPAPVTSDRSDKAAPLSRWKSRSWDRATSSRVPKAASGRCSKRWATSIAR